MDKSINLSMHCATKQVAVGLKLKVLIWSLHIFLL